MYTKEELKMANTELAEAYNRLSLEAKLRLARAVEKTGMTESEILASALNHFFCATGF